MKDYLYSVAFTIVTLSTLFAFIYLMVISAERDAIRYEAKCEALGGKVLYGVLAPECVK